MRALATRATKALLFEIGTSDEKELKWTSALPGMPAGQEAFVRDLLGTCGLENIRVVARSPGLQGDADRLLLPRSPQRQWGAPMRSRCVCLKPDGSLSPKPSTRSMPIWAPRMKASGSRNGALPHHPMANRTSGASQVCTMLVGDRADPRPRQIAEHREIGRQDEGREQPPRFVDARIEPDAQQSEPKAFKAEQNCDESAPVHDAAWSVAISVGAGLVGGSIPEGLHHLSATTAGQFRQRGRVELALPSVAPVEKWLVDLPVAVRLQITVGASATRLQFLLPEPQPRLLVIVEQSGRVGEVEERANAFQRRLRILDEILVAADHDVLGAPLGHCERIVLDPAIDADLDFPEPPRHRCGNISAIAHDDQETRSRQMLPDDAQHANVPWRLLQYYPATGAQRPQPPFPVSVRQVELAGGGIIPSRGVASTPRRARRGCWR